MINWLEATPDNVKKYFYDRETHEFEKNLCTGFCFLTENDDIETALYPRNIDGILFFGMEFLKVTHFCTTAEYESILPKKGA
jgi:hypothetical protein